MASDTTSGQPTTQQARSEGWAAESVRFAILEASVIRREALQAGERVFDALVKAAEARAEQILAEAYQEAERIVFTAQRLASKPQAQDNLQAGGARAALEALRMGTTAAGRRPRPGVRLDTSVPDPRGPGHAAMEPSLDTSIEASDAPPSVPRSDGGSRGHSLHSQEPASDVLRPRQHSGGESLPQRDRRWAPPDWMNNGQ